MAPAPPKPTIISAQAPGSGTEPIEMVENELPVVGAFSVYRVVTE